MMITQRVIRVHYMCTFVSGMSFLRNMVESHHSWQTPQTLKSMISGHVDVPNHDISTSMDGPKPPILDT